MKVIIEEGRRIKMQDQMKYITVEERELFDQLVEKYKMKGYSVPNSLTCKRSPFKQEDSLKQRDDKK
jgi:hypothetical protein